MSLHNESIQLPMSAEDVGAMSEVQLHEAMNRALSAEENNKEKYLKLYQEFLRRLFERIN